MDIILPDIEQKAQRLSINLNGDIARDSNQRPLCGGFADVYRGTMRSTGKHVAIKGGPRWGRCHQSWLSQL